MRTARTDHTEREVSAFEEAMEAASSAICSARPSTAQATQALREAGHPDEAAQSFIQDTRSHGSPRSLQRDSGRARVGQGWHGGRCCMEARERDGRWEAATSSWAPSGTVTAPYHQAGMNIGHDAALLARIVSIEGQVDKVLAVQLGLAEHFQRKLDALKIEQEMKAPLATTQDEPMALLAEAVESMLKLHFEGIDASLACLAAVLATGCKERDLSEADLEDFLKHLCPGDKCSCEPLANCECGHHEVDQFARSSIDSLRGQVKNLEIEVHSASLHKDRLETPWTSSQPSISSDRGSSTNASKRSPRASIHASRR